MINIRLRLRLACVPSGIRADARIALPDSLLHTGAKEIDPSARQWHPGIRRTSAHTHSGCQILNAIHFHPADGLQRNDVKLYAGDRRPTM